MISGIAIVQTTFAGSVHHGVFCTKTVIARGSRFGPFKGRVIHTSEIKTNDDNSCMWEVGNRDCDLGMSLSVRFPPILCVEVQSNGWNFSRFFGG